MPARNIWQENVLTFAFASTATNGANAVQGRVGPFSRNTRIKSIQAVFTSTSQGTVGTATTSASYRRVNALNGGVTGTGTTILASLNLSVGSVASLGSGTGFTIVYPATGTAASSGILSAGQMLVFSQLTVGGTNDDGTILPGGHYMITVEQFG